MQLAAQLLLQQYKSTQVAPATQPAGTVEQSWPCLLLQAPAASQVPAQRPVGSAWLVATPQVCEALHCAQLPGQSASLQQEPLGMQVVVAPTVQAWVPPVQE
jgi:hypothetical protein